jgi:hypothetical protein
MRVPAKCGLLIALAALLALAASADEIRLKNGKKLFGEVVAIEGNMYKVKTDFGYILVEKDKIAAVIPIAPPSPKKESEAAKNSGAKHEPPSAAPVSTPPSVHANLGESAPGLESDAVRPTLPAAARDVKAAAPAIPDSSGSSSDAMAPASAPPPPEPPGPPPNREEVQGNTYINITHGFHMYKPPGWDLIEGVRNSMPNAIVAMGTQDQSTLLVVGQEPNKATLAKAAPTVEKRLHDIYDNYRLLSDRKTLLAGLPAIQYKFEGSADNHDWSGTLVVLVRGEDTMTILGMTYAQTDLIQIQENVIARAISSLTFDAH